MTITYAPQASHGVTQLMAVNGFTDDLPKTVLVKGAVAGLLAALVLGSKRTLLFAAAGAATAYYYDRQGSLPAIMK